MDPDRKRQILKAEARFNHREQTKAKLAVAGVYLVGDLTSEPPDAPPQAPWLDEIETKAP